MKLENKGNDWSYYLIRGVRIGRKPFMATENEQTCYYCNTKSGRLHVLGCGYEPSVCKLHPGKMIDCPCDGGNE